MNLKEVNVISPQPLQTLLNTCSDVFLIHTKCLPTNVRRPFWIPAYFCCHYDLPFKIAVVNTLRYGNTSLNCNPVYVWWALIPWWSTSMWLNQCETSVNNEAEFLISFSWIPANSDRFNYIVKSEAFMYQSSKTHSIDSSESAFAIDQTLSLGMVFSHVLMYRSVRPCVSAVIGIGYCSSHMRNQIRTTSWHIAVRKDFPLTQFQKRERRLQCCHQCELRCCFLSESA